ncbi:MAG: ATP-binding cassette domain-containing protein, partial [Patescibacteria group bacterium]
SDGDVQRQMQPVEIQQATNAAYVNEFASQMPGGLDSMVGEGGSTLSGGQKQRVAIARGLLKNAPIICMDEPTAALDSKSENVIRDSIAKLIANKTVLMVTHRKTLLSLMDRVYVMDGTSLRDVNDFGGLDLYLQKVTDTEATPSTPVETDEQDNPRVSQQQKMAQLEVENAKLAEKIIPTQGQQSAQEGPDGTIFIQH